MKTYTKVTIKEMNTALRPRERLQKYGADYIEIYELIAIIIRSGTPTKNALEIAREVVDLFETYNYAGVPRTELIKIEGISDIKATEILAAYEFGKRIVDMKAQQYNSIQVAEDCVPFIRDIATAKKEHFVALYLDTKNMVIHKEVVSIGTLDSSLVHPREVFEPAYRVSCARIILAHNHPSGDTTPSPEDLAITQQLLEAGRVLGISVLDHIIISVSGYCSLQESYGHIFE